MHSSESVEPIEDHLQVEEFHNKINQLRQNAKQIEGINISDFIDDLEQTGEQLQHSQQLLLTEIQSLKIDLSLNHDKLNYANELRTIDQTTLQTFTNKLHDLMQILRDIKAKERSALFIVQVLRTNTSRLWHILQTAIGITLVDTLKTEDLEKFINSAEKEKFDLTKCLTLLEDEHGNLLIKMKEIQRNIEHFRTTILQTTQNMNELKQQVKNRRSTNNHIYEQSSKQSHNLALDMQDAQRLLFDYKLLVDEINDLVKLIFFLQTQIQIHHKTVFSYQMKLERHKKRLKLNMLKRISCDRQAHQLKNIVDQYNEHVRELQVQQRQIIKRRRELYQHIDSLEAEIHSIVNDQQQLVNQIKHATMEKNLLEKEAFHSKRTIQDLQAVYRKTMKDHNTQEHMADNLQKTIESTEQRLQATKSEVDKFTEDIKRQSLFINNNEVRLQSHTKEIQDLENCLSETHDELTDQRTKVNQGKVKAQLLKQKLHRFTSEEKPLTKEILYYQKLVSQIRTNRIELKSRLKTNESKINQYNVAIVQSTHHSKQQDHLLKQENLLLKQYRHQMEQSNENIKILNINLKDSEKNYQTLKEAFSYMTDEKKMLLHQYNDLLVVRQALGHRQAILDNKLHVSYTKVKHLDTQHLQQRKITEQFKLDLAILQKYYCYVRLYNQQLRQLLLFKSQQYSEYINSQNSFHRLVNFQNQLKSDMATNFNHLSYECDSSDISDNAIKLALIKKKLGHRTDELINLKRIFHEKQILYDHLNEIYLRRQVLFNKLDSNILVKK